MYRRLLAAPVSAGDATRRYFGPISAIGQFNGEPERDFSGRRRSPFDRVTKVGINQCSPVALTQTNHDLALFKENMSIDSNGAPSQNCKQSSGRWSPTI